MKLNCLVAHFKLICNFYNFEGLQVLIVSDIQKKSYLNYPHVATDIL